MARFLNIYGLHGGRVFGGPLGFPECPGQMRLALLCWGFPYWGIRPQPRARHAYGSNRGLAPDGPAQGRRRRMKQNDGGLNGNLVYPTGQRRRVKRTTVEMQRVTRRAGEDVSGLANVIGCNGGRLSDAAGAVRKWPTHVCMENRSVIEQMK